MEKVKFDEQELAEIFQVEDLEKRYEMGWGGSIADVIYYDVEIITEFEIEVG